MHLNECSNKQLLAGKQLKHLDISETRMKIGYQLRELSSRQQWLGSNCAYRPISERLVWDIKGSFSSTRFTTGTRGIDQIGLKDR